MSRKLSTRLPPLDNSGIVEKKIGEYQAKLKDSKIEEASERRDLALSRWDLLKRKLVLFIDIEARFLCRISRRRQKA